MKLLNHQQPARCEASVSQSGSVLVVVMWVVFGLVALTLYFANSMTYELRAADNRVAEIEAEQAIEGARRYISCVLTNLNQPGMVPDPQSYQCEAVPVGNAKFWLIGRTNSDNTTPTTVSFGVVDEASKLNLNSSMVGTNLMTLLPYTMTQDLAYNIMAWRSTNTANSFGGAESDSYLGLEQAYIAKNGSFETVEELRLVYGMDLDILYGEDANQNGLLDANENDGDATAPSDNSDGKLDPGLFDYVTVYTHEPSVQTNGTARFNITTTAGADSVRTNLTALVGQSANQIVPRNSVYTSPLQFFIAASARGLTQQQFMQIESTIRGTNIVGLVNVNTASTAVLQCLPGMDINKATQLVNYRQANLTNPNNMGTVAWLTQVLDQATMIRLGPWVTGKTYQFSVDVAAVGRSGRGYRRTRFVMDTSSGSAVVVYRQDLSHLGWALGKSVRDQMLAVK